MDTRTGQILQLEPGESLLDRALKLECPPEAIVPLDRQPQPKCQHCKGKGAVRTGNARKPFRPCRCTMQRRSKRGQRSRARGW